MRWIVRSSALAIGLTGVVGIASAESAVQGHAVEDQQAVASPPSTKEASQSPQSTSDGPEKSTAATRNTDFVAKSDLRADAAFLKELSSLLNQSGLADAGPGGFALRSLDKTAQLRFHLQIQADGKFWKGTTPAKVNEGFFLRRALPWIDGSLPGGISFLISPDLAPIPNTNSAAMANAGLNLTDAYLQLKLLDGLQIRFGKFRAPIGLERLQPTSALFFNEFAIATELVPLRDVGGQLMGELFGGRLGYAAGVFNGAVDNAYTDIDSSRYKDVEGMLYVKPFGPANPEALQYAVFGVAGTVGRKSGGPQVSGQSTNLPTYKSPGGATIFSYKAVASSADTSNTVVAAGQQRRFNVHGYYAIGPVGLLAEYLYSEQRVALDSNYLMGGNKGWTVEASGFLFGGKAGYAGAQIKSPLSLEKSTFGALEVMVRASQLRFDADLFGGKADNTKPVDSAASVKRATELAAGLIYYWSKSVRLMFSYNYTSYQGGAANDADRPAERLLTGRTQISY